VIFSADTATATSSLLIALFLGAVLSSVYSKSVPAWAQWINLANGLIPQVFLLGVINYGPLTTADSVIGLWVMVVVSGLAFAALIGASGAHEYSKGLQTVNPSSSGAALSVKRHVVLQGFLKKKRFSSGFREETKLTKVINDQVGLGYRLSETSTASTRGNGFRGGDRLQVTLVFERLT
jgi:hypothetical protein